MIKGYEIELRTTAREEIVDITNRIEEIVKKSGVRDGLCCIFVPHATAALIINENWDENVSKDILTYLKKQIPKGIWLHDRVDGNADSHIKSALLGVSQTIPIRNSRLALGKWQGIALVELDGPKQRRVLIDIIC